MKVSAMFKNLQKEERFSIFSSFLITVVSTRSIFFFHPGLHVPHYALGGFFLLIAAVIYLASKKRGFFQLLFLGLGIGLIIDEFTLWFNPYSGDYWALENFFAIFITGSLLFALLLLTKDQNAQTTAPVKSPHINPKTPLISIVIPAFNEEGFLAKTLRSVLSQDFKDFELIVVNNNSTDRTAQIAKRFGAKVVFEANQGVAFARQRGFLAARGEIISTTDADTILPPNWLTRISKEFQKDKDLAAFGGLCNFYSGSIITKFAVFYFLYPFAIVDRLLYGTWLIAGWNLAVRKDAFLKIGGFDTSLKIGEDTDLTRRLQIAGKTVLDPNFKVLTSGRRFRHGLITGVSTYSLNWITQRLTNKHKFMWFPPVRTEKSLLDRVVFLPLLLLLLLLSSLFYKTNPSLAQTKDIHLVRERVVIATSQIKEKNDELKDSLSSIKTRHFKKINYGWQIPLLDWL